MDVLYTAGSRRCFRLSVCELTDAEVSTSVPSRLHGQHSLQGNVRKAKVVVISAGAVGLDVDSLHLRKLGPMIEMMRFLQERRRYRFQVDIQE